MNPDAIRQIEADGLILRPMVEDDAGILVEAGRTDVPNWTFIPRDIDEDRARSWIRRGQDARERGAAVRFVIEVDGEPAGTVGASHPLVDDPGVVETFYFVLPGFRRRGLATTALRILGEWLEETAPELRRIQLHVLPGNPGSEKVAERAGYRREGVAVNRIPPVNDFPARDAIAYGRAISGSVESDVSGVPA